MLTMLADDDSVFAALRVGARGYLLKGAGQAEIVRAVQTVADGGGGVRRIACPSSHGPLQRAARDPSPFPS